MAKEYRLSAERLEELKQEQLYLKTVREKEVAELIKAGKIKEIAERIHALREIGYDNDFAFELAPKAVPEPEVVPWLRDIHRLGERLLAL